MKTMSQLRDHDQQGALRAIMRQARHDLRRCLCRFDAASSSLCSGLHPCSVSASVTQVRHILEKQSSRLNEETEQARAPYGRLRNNTLLPHTRKVALRLGRGWRNSRRHTSTASDVELALILFSSALVHAPLHRRGVLITIRARRELLRAGAVVLQLG